MLLEDVIRQFEAAGHHVSHRDDVDPKAAAWFLGCKPKTLANQRSKRCGPAYAVLPCGIRYRIVDLFTYCEQCRVAA